MRRVRLAVPLLLAALAVSTTGPAFASGGSGSGGSGSGGGGGGGGGTTSTSGTPTATLSPSALTFPAETTGTTSPAQNVAVKSTGTANLFINGLSRSGVAQLDYTVVSDGCSGMTLAPGTSCTLAITFTPSADGTRTMTLNVLDNAANSPQALTLTGTGAGSADGSPTPLTVNTFGMNCSASCDIASPQIVNNFFATSVVAGGGTAPYSWKADTALPPALSLTTDGLLFGTLTTLGTYTFTVTVTDAAGATASQQFDLTVTTSPPPSPSTCQRGPNEKISLTGPSLNGQTPNGQANGDETHLGCGGFTTVTASVSHVNLPNGTVLWVYVQSLPVGTITLSGGSGSTRVYNMGTTALRRDLVTVYAGPPSQTSPPKQVLSGGPFPT